MKAIRTALRTGSTGKAVQKALTLERIFTFAN
jgi:hypothetical protein